jgi:Family of unknown function (DUF6521)
VIDWQARPFEERNLFNPAFCGLVIAAAIREYQKRAGKPMPYSLALLVLPLCLHQASRDAILNNSRSSVLRVFALRPDLLVDFAPRAQSLVQHALEAFALLASKGCITVHDNGGINLLPRKVATQRLSTNDAEMCRSAATILARDFAQINDRVTIYTSLSIRP